MRFCSRYYRFSIIDIVSTFTLFFIKFCSDHIIIILHHYQTRQIINSKLTVLDISETILNHRIYFIKHKRLLVKICNFKSCGVFYCLIDLSEVGGFLPQNSWKSFQDL